MAFSKSAPIQLHYQLANELRNYKVVLGILEIYFLLIGKLWKNTKSVQQLFVEQ